MKTSMIWLLTCALLLVQAAIADDPVISVGAGSYLTSAPTSCAPLPSEIFKTSSIRGPVVTNQWWSSLVWQRHSQNMFAHPAFMRCEPEGLVVGYQGSHIRGHQSGIFGNGDLQNGDLRIGHSQVSDFPQSDCAGYSDWFVTAVMQKEAASLTTSFGHGSPFVYGMIENGDPQVTFKNAPKIWSGGKTDTTLGITVNGNHYGLFGETGSSWEGLDGFIFTNVGRQHSHFSIAILPDDQPETLRLFASCAHLHVTNTQVDYSVEHGHVNATFHFACTPREGSETKTIFALYPHQWKYSSTPLTEMTYGSVRGVMKVGLGTEFSTSIPVQGMLPMLPPDGIANSPGGSSSGLLEELVKESKKPSPDFADTYWEGKYLGTLATLSGIADVTKANDLQQHFLKELKRRLEAWFTATPGKEEPVFYYDANWGTLIGSRPGYGSDKSLNDHHFHYGYFIRAAAEIARLDPAWAKQWGPMVNLLVRDIASPDRKDPMFPHLRCFDLYAGHSWASGDANFADGNNQESSSESLNAWYALTLWGEATEDARIRDLGMFLFNTERTAVEEYWFDVSASNYPTDFPHVALGMVWGGKGAFGTWFSAEIDCIHGINWLPFTPASLYMGRHPEYVKKNYERIVTQRTHGMDFNEGWGDLVLMFGALHDPEPAVRHLTDHPDCKIESGNSRAFMEHWTGTLQTLGHVENSVTSSHPWTSVFVKNGAKSYVAYNFRSEAMTVKFSDGIAIEVPPNALAVSKAPAK